MLRASESVGRPWELFFILVQVKLQRSLEQRFAIKFCVKLEKTAVETVTIIKTAYKEHALSDRQVFWWHKVFLEGREEVDDEDRAGRPSTTTTADNVKWVRELLNSDRRLSVRLMADMLNIPKTQVHEIVTNDIGMRKVCAKMVPEVLTDDQVTPRWNVRRKPRHVQMWSKIFRRHYRWRDLGIWIWPGDQKAIIGVAHALVPSPEESQDEQIKDQDHAHRFFLTSADWFITSL